MAFPMPSVGDRTPDEWRRLIREETAQLWQPAREQLTSYLLHGDRPGGLLQAVLANDLAGAVMRCRDEELLNIRALVAILAKAAPANAQGDYGCVEAWIEGGGIFGLSFSAVASASCPAGRVAPLTLVPA